MNTPQRHLRLRGGFTLLELLIAMIMVTVVATSLYAALSIAFRARDSARAQTEVVGQAMISLDVLEQDFRNAIRPEGTLTAPFFGSMQSTGTGATATVSFCTMGRDGRPFDDAGNVNPFFDGPRWVELSAVSTGQGLTLVRRIRRNLLTETAFEVEEEPLVTGVASFEVGYFDGYAWLDEWEPEAMDNVMPFAVEVILELEAPAPTDPSRNYRLRQVIPLPCGREPEAADTTGAMP